MPRKRNSAAGSRHAMQAKHCPARCAESLVLISRTSGRNLRGGRGARSCEGRDADFNLRLGVSLDATNLAHDRAWGDGRRTLSSGFLKAILLHEPFRTAIPDRGAIIVGAYFPESVDLSDAVLGRPLALRGSWFQGSALLARLKTPGSVSLAASKVDGSAGPWTPPQSAAICCCGMPGLPKSD